MSRARLSDIVLSLTGRDRGQLMLVVAEEGDFLLLANGRARRAENPKRSSIRTVTSLPFSAAAHRYSTSFALLARR